MESASRPVENFCPRVELAAALGNSFGDPFQYLSKLPSQDHVSGPVSTSMIKDESFFRLNLEFNRHKMDEDRCFALGLAPKVKDLTTASCPKLIPSPVSGDSSLEEWYRHFQQWQFPFRTDPIRGLTWGPYPPTPKKVVKYWKGARQRRKPKDKALAPTTRPCIKYSALLEERTLQGIPKYIEDEHFRREVPKFRRLIPILRPPQKPLILVPQEPFQAEKEAHGISKQLEESKRARTHSTQDGEEQEPQVKRNCIAPIQSRGNPRRPLVVTLRIKPPTSPSGLSQSMENKRKSSQSAPANEAKRARTNLITLSDDHELPSDPQHFFIAPVSLAPTPSQLLVVRSRVKAQVAGSVDLPLKSTRFGSHIGLHDLVSILLSPSKAKPPKLL